MIMTLLPLLGIVLVFLGFFLLVKRLLRVFSGYRVAGVILRIEEASDNGLADSMRRVVVQYKDQEGTKKEVATRARVSVGWYTPGETIAVYLSSDPRITPLIGGFQELWLIPLLLVSIGSLCIALGNL